MPRSAFDFNINDVGIRRGGEEREREEKRKKRRESCVPDGTQDLLLDRQVS
jgi:hypothetical protein